MGFDLIEINLDIYHINSNHIPDYSTTVPHSSPGPPKAVARILTTMITMTRAPIVALYLQHS